MEKAPAGITGSFSMLFLMVFGRFHEKFSFGIFFPLQHLILFAYVFGVVFTSFFDLLLCTGVHCCQIKTCIWPVWFDKQCRIPQFLGQNIETHTPIYLRHLIYFIINIIHVCFTY